ncbi:hypothetical protein C8Q73DRAFT_833442 [Cubamyces lactineus]|nr:hypothetical protein C8Q73DRAFT_833442 [Cubamyces lactineus]
MPHPATGTPEPFLDTDTQPSGRRFSSSTCPPSQGVDSNDRLLAAATNETAANRLSLFVDKVANIMKLNAAFRAELHAFRTLVCDLPESFWRVCVYQQASVYRVMQLSEDFSADLTSLKGEVKELGNYVSKRFIVSQEQNDDILALCKVMVFEAGRHDYNFADDAVKLFKDPDQYPRFKDVFKSNTNTKTVKQLIRRQASYVRNAYRQFLRDSLFDAKKKCGLSECARQAARKFKNGVDTNAEEVLHVAILRRFVRENRQLVLETEEEDIEAEDPWKSTSGSLQEPSTGRRKRKRARTTMHFWGAANDWLRGLVKALGSDLRNAGWQAFYDETLRQERALFPDDVLSDVPLRTVLTAPSASEATRSGAQAASSDFRTTVNWTTSHDQLASVSLSNGSMPSTGYSASSTTPSLPPMATFAPHSPALPFSPSPAPRNGSIGPGSRGQSPSPLEYSSQPAAARSPGTERATANRPRPRPRPVRMSYTDDLSSSDSSSSAVARPPVSDFRPQLPGISELARDTAPSGILFAPSTSRGAVQSHFLQTSGPRNDGLHDTALRATGSPNALAHAPGFVSGRRTVNSHGYNDRPSSYALHPSQTASEPPFL